MQPRKSQNASYYQKSIQEKLEKYYLFFVFFEAISPLSSNKPIARRKNAAAYQVRCSAVKKIHFAKSGMATRRHVMPAKTNTFGFRRKRRITSTKRKTKSCGFMLLFYEFHADMLLFSMRNIQNQICKKSSKNYLKTPQHKKHTKSKKRSPAYCFSLEVED